MNVSFSIISCAACARVYVCVVCAQIYFKRYSSIYKINLRLLVRLNLYGIYADTYTCLYEWVCTRSSSEIYEWTCTVHKWSLFEVRFLYLWSLLMEYSLTTGVYLVRLRAQIEVYASMWRLCLLGRFNVEMNAQWWLITGVCPCILMEISGFMKKRVYA